MEIKLDKEIVTEISIYLFTSKVDLGSQVVNRGMVKSFTHFIITLLTELQKKKLCAIWLPHSQLWVTIEGVA